MDEYIVVLVTCSNREEAEAISSRLLEDRLAACINIINSVQSFFHWEGKIDQADEVIMCIKTRRALFSALRDKVKALHSYKVPEIIALSIIEGDKAYLKWVNDETQQGT